MAMSDMKMARFLALGTPLALLGGALIGQYGFGLYPCEMCWWQRYPHAIAALLGAYSFVQQKGRIWVALAGLCIAVSGAIGLFHAGVEYHWWEGLTACTSNVAKSDDPLAAIMDAPMIRCDVAQWSLFGISLAGFNFLISSAAALAIFGLLLRGRKAA
jgi:disulfide bond formation protein DsbB